MFSRSPGPLRKTCISAGRSGLRYALKTLAKGYHKIWVARDAAKRVDRSQITTPVDASGSDSVDSLLSRVDEDEIEVSQTCRVDA